jgi:uncharacterized protein (TIGR03437 family)
MTTAIRSSLPRGGKRSQYSWAALCFAVLLGAGMAQAQTITSVSAEGGSNIPLCPGGVAFVNGTNLGTSTAIAVTIGGKAAYVFNAFGGTSLQIEIPVELPTGATTVKVANSAPFNITLAQFSPGVPVVVPAPNYVTAIHLPSNLPVTASFPATPNEQIAVLATGLGPTNPVIATGNVPGDNSAVVATYPTVSVAGKSATVSTAYLSTNSVGFYWVVFTMRGDVITGSQNFTVSVGGFTSNTGLLPVSTGPVVASVANAASYITARPRAGVAQGAVFVLQGLNMGPTTLAIDPHPFQNNSLAGTSVSITVNGTTVAAPMYYTSAGQVAALLPSNAPTGNGTVTVTYNNNTGPAAPISVFPNGLGIFTVTSDGQGAGIVTYPDYSLVSTTKAANCGGVYTTCGAANPGDVLTIWATGLGAITGNDTSGAGLGVDMTSLPVTVWLGNVAVTPIYRGRSGCCIGEDQIAFIVPANTPLGCGVPLSVQITSGVNLIQSNSVALPIAASGSRTCTPSNPAYTVAAVQQLATGNATVASIDFKRVDNYPGGMQDIANGQFIKVAVPVAYQPFAFSYVDLPPSGSCQVYNSTNGQSDPPFGFTPLDAGAQLTLQGPNGTKTANSGDGEYRTVLSNNGTYFSPGVLTTSLPGGRDVSKFTMSLTLPALPTLTSPPPDSASGFSVTRANGMTVTWTGGSPAGLVEIFGIGATDNTYTAGATFDCLAPAGPGTFTVPPNILLAMPATNFGALYFHALVGPTNFPGTNLNATETSLYFETFANLIFK